MIQLNLFSNDTNRISNVDFFKKKDFIWFKALKPLKREDIFIINQFYDMMYDWESPPLYLGDAINASVENKTNVKWIIVQFPDDEVLFVYKTFQFMGTNIMHVFDKPISKTNEQNALLVLNHLKSLSYVSFIFKEKYMQFYDDVNVKRKDIYDDYYYDLEKDYVERFGNSKWLKKTGIRKVLNPANDYHYEIVIPDELYKDKLVECRKTWWEGKNNSTKDSCFKFLLNTFKVKDNILNFCLFYKDDLLAYSTDIVYPDKKYAIRLLLAHIGRNNNEMKKKHPSINNNILSNLDDCIRYFIGTELLKMGVKREYCLGYMPSEKALKTHKQNTTSGCIKYFIAKKDK